MSDIEELKQILSDHEARLKKLESVENSLKSQKKESKKNEKSRVDLLNELKAEGFFNQPQYIGVIAEKCTERSYYTKSPDLTKPLQTAVRSGLLRRVKQDKKWAYVASRLSN